jgi:hypothetical protein
MKWRALASPSFVIAALSWCVAMGLRAWTSPVALLHAGSGGSYRYNVPFTAVSPLGPTPLVVPVALCAAALWASAHSRLGVLTGLSVLFCVLCFAGGFTLGGAYIPAAGFLVLATVAAAAVNVSMLGA